MDALRAGYLFFALSLLGIAVVASTVLSSVPPVPPPVHAVVTFSPPASPLPGPMAGGR